MSDQEWKEFCLERSESWKNFCLERTESWQDHCDWQSRAWMSHGWKMFILGIVFGFLLSFCRSVWSQI